MVFSGEIAAMHAVVLNRNGRLLHTLMDDSNGNGHARQVSRDVTREAHSYLFEPVVLGPGVRLMDLFFVLSLCEPLRDIYRRQWAHELLQEVCDGSPPPYTGQHDPQGIEYLELSQVWEFNTKTAQYQPMHRMTFKGVGYALQAADCENRKLSGYKPGDRLTHSLATLSPLDIIEVPIQVNPAVDVCEGDLTAKNFGKVVAVVQNPAVTWGQVLDAVLCELSFFGGPEQRRLERQASASMISRARRSRESGLEVATQA
jgi:hypothetical protein